VAVRAIGHATVAVFFFARHVDFAPACAGGQDNGFALDRTAVGQLDLDRLARHQRFGALQVHDVDLVGLDVLFERHSELRPFGFLHGNEVLDGHGVQHLPAETLGQHAGADALARGIHGGRGAGGAAAHDQYVELFFGVELFGLAAARIGVELGKDFFNTRAALAEHFAIHVDGGHRHDLALVD